MSASAKGTVEKPGKNVKQKSGLNRAILDQGWFEFRRQLDYKLQWAGGKLVLVPAHYTSQTCPNCGTQGPRIGLCGLSFYVFNADTKITPIPSAR